MKYKIIESLNYKTIQQTYHYSTLLSKIIDFKKIDHESLQELINPRLIYHDFSLFEEAEMTIERIEEAIDNEEKICIYGDYDCDGILATTILVQAFLQRGVRVGYHIPNRFEDGYGLNGERVKQIAEKGYSLIITVDNGVKSFDAIECANELGVDVIVTDHHQFDVDLPDAYSFIHTKLSPKYPFKEISGGYVAYKLASALLKKHDKYLYCLAAITTVSDMMPLLDENRSLVKRALYFMKEEKYPSLELLLGKNQTYDMTSLGFTIAPKINSFGRLPEICHPNILVKYFLKDAPQELLMKVSQMATQINEKRKNLISTQYAPIKEQVHEKFLYYSSEDIHEGIIGLVAGNYTRDYEIPSFVMHYDKDKQLYRGSARSVKGFSLHEFFFKHSDMFVQCGGHSQAGGFAVDEDHYEVLRECLSLELKDIHFDNEQYVLKLNDEDISIQSVESLSLLEPFGMCNETPLVYLEHVSSFRVFTIADGQHLKLEINYPHISMQAIYFGQGKLLEHIKNQKEIALIGTLSISVFKNIKSVHLMIKDILYY